MQKMYNRLLSAMILVLLAVLPTFGFGGGSNVPTAETKDPVITGEMISITVPVRQQGSKEILEVPLFSDKYANLPVATVNGEPITLKEFSLELATMHSDMGNSETPGGLNFSKLLDRLITIKLVKQEALNIGFDQTPEVQNKIKNFSLKTMIQQLLATQVGDVQVPDEEVEKLYGEMALEAKLLTYRFSDKADAEDLIDQYRSGGDFQILADKMVAAQKAEGGEEPEYVKLKDLFPQVAKAVYNMEAGAVSEIYKAEKGHLVFRLEDLRVYEDPEIRQMAENRLVKQQSLKLKREYLKTLIEKYATFDEEVEATLDFVKLTEENPQIKGTEIFPKLKADKRTLVTLANEQETVAITVAEIAKKLESSMYHGMDQGHRW